MFACGKVVKCPSQKRVGFSKTARNIRLKIVSSFIFWNHGMYYPLVRQWGSSSRSKAGFVKETKLVFFQSSGNTTDLTSFDKKLQVFRYSIIDRPLCINTMVYVSTVQPSINLKCLCSNKNIKMSLYTLFKVAIYKFSYMKSYAWNYSWMMKKLM